MMRKTPLTNRQALGRHVRLQPQSSKRRRQQRQRRVVLERLVAERGDRCQAGLSVCAGEAVDGHELVRRSQGGDPTCAEQIILVCRECHRHITENPIEAVALGLARWGWQR